MGHFRNKCNIMIEIGGEFSGKYLLLIRNLKIRIIIHKSGLNPLLQPCLMLIGTHHG